ncbi:MAG: hypothetical protein K0Q66_2135 [Chitinophagaceae bacterium]|jgi:hypothetical protein|nr:hypothetical protein [Chitinophagaceae bacterium]
MAESKNAFMKSKILSLLGIGAIVFAVACNSADDETDNKDSGNTAENTENKSGVTGTASVQTTADGRSYVVRTRASTSSGTTGGTSAGATAEYDTVWVYRGTDSRYYTLRGDKGRDTLYFDTDDWKSWWSSPETDNELKLKSGDTKVKVDDDGSYKVKDGNSKTKVNEEGKTKTKKDD